MKQEKLNLSMAFTLVFDRLWEEGGWKGESNFFFSILVQWDKCTDSNCEDSKYSLTTQVFDILALYIVLYTP